MAQGNNYSSTFQSSFTSPIKSIHPSFASPYKPFKGLKALIQEASSDEDTVQRPTYDELAYRKAEEAAYRRYQAAEWLRKMDQGAFEAIPNEPSEEEFCLALRNGLILCNVLNKVNPGSVSKVVENPIFTVQSADGAAQSAIQYFENMRNFLVAVEEMKLLTFEASDLEKGGSSIKVVDCILCLKGYHEWKLAGGTGIWKYGGIVKIPPSIKGLPSSSLRDGEIVGESLDNAGLPCNQRLLELHLSRKVSFEESEAAAALCFLFDRFGVELLHAFLTDRNGFEDFPLNAMVIDFVLGKAVKEFNEMLVTRGNQLGLVLKELLENESNSLSKAKFLAAASKYLDQRVCGVNWFDDHQSASHKLQLDLQQQEVEELKLRFQENKDLIQWMQSKWNDELKEFKHHIQGLTVSASSYHKLLEENRLLHNQVQDLKGSIRVYCRVRPFLHGQPDGQSSVDYIGENGNIMIVNPHKSGKDSRRIFSFDRVFGTNATQEQVFADTQPLIKSVLDGYNVCIFAYGQTGSGKTYTMSGPDLTTEETWGVNYRALSNLFQFSKDRKDLIRYEVSVQMIEIYNEQVRDLLVVDGASRRLDIRNNSQQNGLNVPDASLVSVHSTEDVLDLMRTGQRNRAVGATALNERSSRSHSVLTVHVEGMELASGSILRGCLHLVDLAGSERVDKSEAVGERLKEAQHINRSLSALGDVISSLAQKSTHIPYRNSKLTQLLQDSLGGQAKTLMFVHINPEINAFGETISSLKFAERVASVELGAARSNKESGEIKELKEEISNLRLALEKKEGELEQVKGGKNYRSTADIQKMRGLSPLRLPKQSSDVNSRPETNLQPIDDSGCMEVRSCSSGKQRKTRFPLVFTDKEVNPLPLLINEESFITSRKLRSPSPPIRRSLSADRSNVTKSRIPKLDLLEEKAAGKLQFPAKIFVNRPIPIPPMNDNSGRCGPQELTKKDSISEVFYQLSRAHHPRRVHPENEEEQFKPALNVRQGGIRKSKPELKAKLKHQLPVRTQKSDVALMGPPDMDPDSRAEENRKSDFSEAENELGFGFVLANSASTVKKLHQNLSRPYQILEPRASVQIVEPLSAGKHENKIPDNVLRYGKEGSSKTVADLRRSRSSPRGKFVFLS